VVLRASFRTPVGATAVVEVRAIVIGEGFNLDVFSFASVDWFPRAADPCSLAFAAYRRQLRVLYRSDVCRKVERVTFWAEYLGFSIFEWRVC
jgi:hypothetical protein